MPPRSGLKRPTTPTPALAGASVGTFVIAVADFLPPQYRSVGKLAAPTISVVIAALTRYALEAWWRYWRQVQNRRLQRKLLEHLENPHLAPDEQTATMKLLKSLREQEREVMVEGIIK